MCKGYFPGYSALTERAKTFFTWAIVKAHTNNTAGEVCLRSNDPLAMPDVNFHYFDEGNDPKPKEEDLESVVQGVLFARQMHDKNRNICRERVPGREIEKPEHIPQWIKDTASRH